MELLSATIDAILYAGKALVVLAFLAVVAVSLTFKSKAE